MKYIVKNKEPQSLKTYRSTPNPTYDSCNKEDIRLALIKEQGAICAYCMQRISNKRVDGKPKTEIEHYKSQDVYNGKNDQADLRLNYNNMLGVCNGNAGQPLQKQHCDKSKDARKNKPFLPLTIDPLKQNCEKQIQFKGNGTICSKNEIINRDIDVTLNLNERNLKINRETAISKAITNIKQKTTANQAWNIANVKAELKKWKEQSAKGFQPYCHAVIYYLEKKIEKLNQ